MYSLSLIVLLATLGCAIGFAQHPGAYSSPHYAKKSMQYVKPYNQPGPYGQPEYQKVQTMERQDNIDRTKHQEIDLQEYGDQKPEQSIDDNHLADNLNVTDPSGRSSGGFMASASNFLNGRGGQMLADIAREMIVRSTGASSQVLSLNLTNLVILVILKALILAAGMFGAGAWHREYARSLNEHNSMWIDEKELALWMGYLKGGDYSCLIRASCDNPDLAIRYGNGADLLLTGAKIFQNTLPYDSKYEDVVNEMKEAAKWGSSGMSCDRYKSCTQN